MSGEFGDVSTLLRAVARNYPDHEAIVESGARLSFGQWAAATEATARFFQDLGLGRGDVVCLVLPPSIDYAVAYHAAIRLGAVTSGVNPRLGPGEVASILARTRPLVMVIDDGAGPGARAALDWAASSPPGPGRRSAVVDRGLLAGYRSGPGPLDPEELLPSDPVAVVWTSGTTGVPKGAIFSHANLKAVAEGVGVLSEPGDRRLSPLPFAHVGYMTRAWDELAHVITTVITPSPWRAGDCLALMESERVTVAQGVPTQWSLMLDHPRAATTDYSCLRLAGTGGSTVAPALVGRMRAVLGVPVVVRYTSTEAALTTGTAVGDDDERVALTVGRPAGNVELKLVDSSGSTIPSPQVGVVCVRSGAVMGGYWDDPAATAQVLDADGWLHTGDLGFLDGDGDLTLVGRHIEMYIRGGYNVYPSEVEKALSSHPALAQVAVIGIADPVLGQVGQAFVVLEPGAEEPSLAELQHFCRRHLADYKAPDCLVVLSAMPVTSMFKVNKAELANWSESTSEPEPASEAGRAHHSAPLSQSEPAGPSLRPQPKEKV